MRPKGGLASIKELTGSKELSLDNINAILGEKRPELPKNKVGRFRLIRALRHRFGDNYRNLPGVKGIIQEFDEEIRFNSVKERIKKLKPGESRG